MHESGLRIAYLVNQYPKVSHSFIRREIAGLEALGIPISRFSIRSCQAELVDPLDQREAEVTQTVLEVGAFRLAQDWGKTIVTRPIPVLRSLKLALQLGRVSESGILRHLIYWAEACVLLQWFKQARIQHVHAHFGTNSTTVALLCKAMGGPSYSFTVHGPEEFDSVKPLSLVEKVRHAEFAVTVSCFGRSQLYRWCELSQWEKIKIVRCGVDKDYLAQPLTPIPEELRLVCVGRLCEAKGQLLLVQAVQQLVAEGIPLKLVLVGDGPLRSQLEAQIAQAGLENHIEITGWADSDRVCQELLAARVMVLPSFAEGLPVAIMEALALGRPVISTYIAGIPELLVPGICGWVVPPGSVEALTDALREALHASPEALAQMGKAGAERVAQYHNATTEAEKLAELLKGCLQPGAIELTPISATSIKQAA